MNSSASDALARALFDFDGKRTDALEAFADSHRADASLVAECCDFAASDDSNLQTAATWLLKRFAVTGAQLSARQSETLLGLLLRETSWLPRIHVLQMMDTLVVPKSLAEPLMRALNALSSDTNTFIRAWSVHGAATLADQHPTYRDNALELLVAAEQEEAPSVRARIRQTRRAFDWC